MFCFSSVSLWYTCNRCWWVPCNFVNHNFGISSISRTVQFKLLFGFALNSVTVMSVHLIFFTLSVLYIILVQVCCTFVCHFCSYIFLKFCCIFSLVGIPFIAYFFLSEFNYSCFFLSILCKFVLILNISPLVNHRVLVKGMFRVWIAAWP